MWSAASRRQSECKTFGLETCLKGENLCNWLNLWEEEEPGYLNFKRPNGVEMVTTLRVPVTSLHHITIIIKTAMIVNSCKTVNWNTQIQHPEKLGCHTGLGGIGSLSALFLQPSSPSYSPLSSSIWYLSSSNYHLSSIVISFTCSKAWRWRWLASVPSLDTTGGVATTSKLWKWEKN